MTERRETPGEYLDRRYMEYTTLAKAAGERLIGKYEWELWPDAHYRLTKGAQK